MNKLPVTSKSRGYADLVSLAERPESATEIGMDAESYLRERFPNLSSQFIKVDGGLNAGAVVQHRGLLIRARLVGSVSP